MKMIDLGKILFPDMPREVRKKKLRTIYLILLGSFLITLYLLSRIYRRYWH